MKIKITKIDTLNGDGSITLEECADECEVVEE